MPHLLLAFWSEQNQAKATSSTGCYARGERRHLTPTENVPDQRQASVRQQQR
jgi:hypothetical protein